MPGIFGYVGKGTNGNLDNEIISLLNHGEDWFEGKSHHHSLGFHGVSDFHLNMDSDIHSFEDISIVVYGNVYSHKDQELKGKKSENLLRLYKDEGIDFLKHLDGSFILSICDKERIIIANDRLGSKNLFYAFINENLIYSSEIKGVLASDYVKPILSADALSEYFTFTYLLDDKTLFKGVELLSPGTYLAYEKGKMQLNLYYKLEINRESFDYSNKTEVLKRFSSILEEAVYNRMKDKKRIGVFLSGGLDSRLLAGFAKRVADKTGKKIITFTFGTKGGRQEKIAKEIAKRLNLENHFYEIPSDSISKHANEIVYKGDGHIRIRDAHFISHLRDIQSHVDTVLVGLFCSELFGEEMIKDISGLKSRQGLINYLWKWYDYKKVSQHKSKIFSNNIKITSKALLKDRFKKSLEAIDAESNNDISHLWEISQRDRRYIIAINNYISWYLEARLPFLDNKIVEFALPLPINLKVNKKLIHLANSTLFPILANIPWEKSGLPPNFPGLLELSFKIERYFIQKIKELIQQISQNKIVFRNLDYRAYGYHLRKGSQRFTVDVLLNKIQGEMWNKEYIRTLVKEHMNLKKNHEIILCDLIQIELLNKLYFESS